MTHAPLLLIGGSGVVGQYAARYLRAEHPTLPLLIGGRNQAKAQEVAASIAHAEGVAIDLTTDDLGLGDRQVSGVVVLVKDETLASVRFAQARGVPHVSISSGAAEIGPDMAAWLHHPEASAVVLGADWLVGSATIPAVKLAERFRRVDTINVGALLDEQEAAGPATEHDFKRLGEIMPAALTRRDGAFYWRAGENASARFHAVDGTPVEATAFSPFDIMGLANATSAPNIAFNLATGITSSRRRGEGMSTEIIIDMQGEGLDGEPLRLRQAVVHPQGQRPLTATGVTLLTERVLGLDGRPAQRPGLYFPYQLIDFDTWKARMTKTGGQLLSLAVL
ncbi:NAD(P)-dependent oxidoreductase [Siccibacter turicensis]|uniref:NAD(P)-dependent oxidoreductase n=1 Tax=Siccibacter turicensis TaxID=357233 RepID=UPI001020928A|nr:NAD(P)-dependent oxidoreductase [Siccibacter turicensis]